MVKDSALKEKKCLICKRSYLEMKNLFKHLRKGPPCGSSPDHQDDPALELGIEEVLVPECSIPTQIQQQPSAKKLPLPAKQRPLRQITF